ncbi:MAG: hypothetical protein C0603_07855 [Denitrovibrio sp.]|nr:MAG: hypothetical protein C0603_07855 [Denitrovibrio sp.]
MKERVLEIRKEILPMKDAFEQLNIDEREELEALQKEHDELHSQLSDADKEWYDSELGTWYEKYLHVETTIFIKPCEG